MATKKSVRADRDGHRSQLRHAGLRATNARLEVMAVLKGANKPLSHSDVCEALDDQAIDRATVYRNLVDLADAGLARRSDLGDHVWRFELEHGSGHHHASHVHFVCTSCGDVTCLPGEAVQVVPQRNLPRSLSGEVQVSISGLCDTCL